MRTIIALDCARGFAPGDAVEVVSASLARSGVYRVVEADFTFAPGTVTIGRRLWLRSALFWIRRAWRRLASSG